MKNHDWWWMMADYTHPAIDNARGSMRYFVELVATIKDAVVRNAMRELWKATYENVHKNMWSKNEEANKVYEAKKQRVDGNYTSRITFKWQLDMEMAQYIMSIFKAKLMVVWSWGVQFSNGYAQRITLQSARL